MPKTPTDYSKTIIYKICCKDPSILDVYIGHTTHLNKRRNVHKANTLNSNNKDYNMYVYNFIRNNGGWDNWNIIMIEQYPCNNKLEATKRERELIEELKATLNKRIPFKTIDELKENQIKCRKNWEQNNKNYIIEKQKEYTNNNIEEIKQRRQQKILCECGMTISYQCFSRHQNRNIHLNKIKEFK